MDSGLKKLKVVSKFRYKCSTFLSFSEIVTICFPRKLYQWKLIVRNTSAIKMLLWVRYILVYAMHFWNLFPQCCCSIPKTNLPGHFDTSSSVFIQNNYQVLKLKYK